MAILHKLQVPTDSNSPYARARLPPPRINLKIIDGDLLDQPVDVIVNAGNISIHPWWLLISQGVSGAINKRAGLQPFPGAHRSRSNSAGTSRGNFRWRVCPNG
jgi:hypothetical protein